MIFLRLDLIWSTVKEANMTALPLSVNNGATSAIFEFENISTTEFCASVCESQPDCTMAIWNRSNSKCALHTRPKVHWNVPSQASTSNHKLIRRISHVAATASRNLRQASNVTSVNLTDIVQIVQVRAHRFDDFK